GTTRQKQDARSARNPTSVSLQVRVPPRALRRHPSPGHLPMSATISREHRIDRRHARPPSLDLSVKAVRDELPSVARERSSAVGAAYFAVSAAAYVATFVALALAPTWWARVALALLNGLMAGVLFVVGHDACHGSLTPRLRLNAWLGRAAFL